MSANDGWNDWEPNQTITNTSSDRNDINWGTDNNMSQNSDNFNNQSKGTSYENKRKLSDDSFEAQNDRSGVASLGRGRAKRIAESDDWHDCKDSFINTMNSSNSYSSKPRDDNQWQDSSSSQQDNRESNSWRNQDNRESNSWGNRDNRESNSWGNRDNRESNSWGNQDNRESNSWGNRDNRESNSWGNRDNRESNSWENRDNRESNSWGNRDNRESNSWGNRDNRSFGSNNRSGGDSKRTIKISSSFVGRVIGRGGSTIKDLQSKSGSRISINKETSNSFETDIDLSGSNEQMDSAQQLIEELVGNSNTGNSYNSSQSNYNQNRSQVKEEETVKPNEEFIDWGAAIAESEAATKLKWASLPPINKSFYFEDNDIRVMNPEDVDGFRLQMNNIMVSHFNEEDNRPIPNPVQTFEQAFEHYPEIMEEIRKQGFEKPSPIQCQSWPILLQGFDLIGIAQTGTGKTLAYLLPAMIHIDNQQTKREERPGPTALILAPTRELAQQIEKETQKYRYRNIKCICIYGGGDRKAQINSVDKGVEIVIATPGRLNDLCMNNHINLTAVSYLVLDEADRMLDMGFEPQIKKIMLDIRPERHTVMMSATWPASVRRLANNYMKDPIQIYVGTLDLAAVHSVTQKIVMCTPEEKRDIMYEFIRNMAPNEKVIIFLGRKAVADDLSSDCVLRGINCQSIHGDRDQHDREQALEDIRQGVVNILFATDVASRGLDIEDITHIFNYDFPRNVEDYVHRVGRTGRSGRTGASITLVTREDWKHAQELIKILVEADQVVPEGLVSMSERYAVWKEKHDAEVAACGGRRGGRGGGRGGGFGRRF